jgi:hypothetical protein
MGDAGLVSAANRPQVAQESARRTAKHTVDLTVGSLQLADSTSAGNPRGGKGRVISRHQVSPDWPR